MTDLQQRTAAKRFVETWKGRGKEKQETQAFWKSLLRDVYGIERPEEFIEFEVPVKLGHTSFIDGYIKETQVLIEQKGMDIDLKKGYPQSDGSKLTPFGQARRYAGFLPHNMNPRWIVVCNFKTFEIHDMNNPNSDPEVVQLDDMEREYHRLQFLVDTGKTHLQKEMEVSMAAGEIVGKIYDAFYSQYMDPSEESLKSLNKLCVRLVFCLYAEDAGIFGKKGMFRDYLEQFDTKHLRNALSDLFRVLDTKPEDRGKIDKYMDPDLAAFPYVNGGLFADEDIEIPPLTDHIRELLLYKASEDFDWSDISPTIFGAVFESTLNPDTRRKGGMHYTSIENIHKVIDPLFLDGLREELAEAKQKPVAGGSRTKALRTLHDKLATLTFLDPACGSGNFLTETYLSIRRLENEIIYELYTDADVNLGEGGMAQMALIGMADAIFESLKIKVSIGQFYGIEINDFAVTVAKTALWIAESQMLKETEAIVHMSIDFLPLKSYANIMEGNALRVDWDSVVPRGSLNYIMGNPPFVGYAYQTPEQKDDMLAIGKLFPEVGKNIDYVAAWYFKAAEYMVGTKIRTAFVSTNSITQGEQVAAVWKPMYEAYGIHIDFAHRTFRWDSEASVKAHVHCVIVGFSIAPNAAPRRLYSSDRLQLADNISPYLLDAPVAFIERRTKPLCSVPEIYRGSQPTDDGNFILTEEEKDEMLAAEPEAAQFIRPYMMGKDFINRKPRYCIWLVDADPSSLKKCRNILKRIENVRAFRLLSKKAATRAKAETAMLFDEIHDCKTDYVAIPKVSSENRRYVPMDYLKSEVIAGDKIFMMPNATLYDFGVLTSNVHMAWMRAVCGRLEMRYSYSNTIVYNNFPWPTPTEAQRAKIEQTAKAIMDARDLYPNSTLADLYDETVMPPALRTAHQKNDRAVMEAYGFWGKLNSETECVAALMKMYQHLTEKEGNLPL